MSQAKRMRCMEDFLINPTISTGQHRQHPKWPLTEEHSAPPTTRRRKTLPHNPDVLFDFWPTYTSDEELASPLDDDESAGRGSISSNFSLQEVLEAYTIDQPQYKRAQTMVIQSAGRARMISMPKVLDTARRNFCILSSAEVTRTSMTIPQPKSSVGMPDATRTSQDSSSSTSRSNSLSSAAPQSPASTAPSSVCDDKEEATEKATETRISRHVDLMQAARAFSPTSPTSPTSPMLYRSSTHGGEHSTPSIRRKSKFTSGFTLNRISKTLVRRDPTADDMEGVKEPEPVMVPRTAPQPTRYSSGRPKLIARAANERAPPITLPPFPDE